MNATHGLFWVAVLCLTAWSAFGTEFTVTNTTDGGPGSLRQALEDANALPGADSISFNIGAGGQQTISVTSALPVITDTVTVDATTQPGFASIPLIFVNGGSRDIPAFVLTAGHCVFRGLGVQSFGRSSSPTRFGHAFHISGPGSNLIESSWIGLSTSGTSSAPIRGDGFSIVDSPNNIIGGMTPDKGCVISDARQITVEGIPGGGCGVRVSGTASTGNKVLFNRIGTNAAGDAAVANSIAGVFMDNAGANFIGMAGAGNLVSGNSFCPGILIRGSQGGNMVLGNLIGLNAAGTAKLPNDTGVRVEAPFVAIGGVPPDQRNVISGNSNVGILLFGKDAHHNQIAGNYIGIDPAGTTDLGNTDDGVRLGHDNTASGLDGPRDNIVSDCVISGNGNVNGSLADGVSIGGDAAKPANETTGANILLRNLIGVDVTGSLAMGNMNNGVAILYSSNNKVGTLGNGNIISSNGSTGVVNTGSGVNISGSTSSGNSVQANAIGTNAAHTAGLGNKRSGIHCSDLFAGNPVNTLIGGFRNPACGNYIAFNDGNGFTIAGGTALVTGNALFQNGGLSIDVIFNDNEGDPTPGIPSLNLNSPDFLDVKRDDQGGIVLHMSYTGLKPGTDYEADLQILSGQGAENIGRHGFRTDENGNATLSVGHIFTITGGQFVQAHLYKSSGRFGDFTDLKPTEVAQIPFPASDTSHTPLEWWRNFQFGTFVNSGAAADTADPNRDGIPNFQHFAQRTEPDVPGPPPLYYLNEDSPATDNPGGISFRLIDNGATMKAELFLYPNEMAPGVIYGMEKSEDAMYWIQVTPNIRITPGIALFSQTPPGEEMIGHLRTNFRF